MKHVRFVTSVEGQFAKSMPIPTKSVTRCTVSFINIEGKGMKKGVSYPNARKYIRGLDDLDKETKETYEFEATLCEAVIRTFGSHVCPNCGGRVFRIGDITVNFNVPFVDGSRVRIFGLRSSRSVKCARCGLRKPLRTS